VLGFFSERAVAQSLDGPMIERNQGVEAKIDTENFEIGVYGGALSLVNFNVNASYGVRLGYHLTEDFFAEFGYGMSQASESNFERLNGVSLLSDAERDLTATSFSLGWHFAPSEVFITPALTLTSQGFLMAGVGKVSFGGQSETLLDVGIGYRSLLLDWLALRLDVKDRIFNSDIFGVDEKNHNFELTVGLSVFF